MFQATFGKRPMTRKEKRLAEKEAKRQANLDAKLAKQRAKMEAKEAKRKIGRASCRERV